ncbi:MAG: hypothetical protein IEMM0008_0113 [bacterium]|nr:MAG: hypothetical protein IEMM0008_0113 [bacterium]
MKWYRNLKIRHKTWLLSTVSALALLFIWSVLNNTLDNIERIWDNHQHQVIARERYLSNIKATLGHRSMVDNFKNYVLRGEMKYISRFEGNLERLKETIRNYKKLINTSSEDEEQEIIALNKLEEIAIEYHNELKKVKKLRLEKKSIKQIDQAVLINTLPASEAYHAIEKRLTAITKRRGGILTTLIQDMSIYLFVFFVGLIIFYALFNSLLSKSITRPIIKGVNFAKDIARGDLTATININTKEETGELAKSLVYMRDSLIKMIADIDEVSTMVSSNGEEISQSAYSLSEVARDQVNNIEEMNSKITHLDQEICLSTQSAIDVDKFIASIVDLIASQASSITESSASIEQMSAAIQNIDQVVETKLDITTKLENRAQEGEKEMRDTTEVIQKVVNSTNVIIDMTKIINEIAEQTHLLSMNAAIEAAHAGEAGLGFAVVAEEVRNLANRSAKSSKEITKSLKEIVQLIHISKESSDKTAKVFSDIVKEIKEVTQGMLETRSATQEMSTGSRQMMEVLDSLISLTEEVKSSSDEMKVRAGSITQSMGHLRNISTDAKRGMDDLSTSVYKLSSNVSSMSVTGEKNTDNVQKLKELVNQFQTNELANPKYLQTKWANSEVRWLKLSPQKAN